MIGFQIKIASCNFYLSAAAGTWSRLASERPRLALLSLSVRRLRRPTATASPRLPVADSDFQNQNRLVAVSD
jgi:hypothetical protein